MMKTILKRPEKIKDTADTNQKNAVGSIKNAAVKDKNVCQRCGAYVGPGMSFCSYCGVELGMPLEQADVKSFEKLPDLAPGTSCASNETELYRLNNVGHGKGLVPCSGKLVITSRHVYFMPADLYVYQKPVTIAICDITGVALHETGELDCIKITTLTGVTYKFILFIRDTEALQSLVKLINQQRRNILERG